MNPKLEYIEDLVTNNFYDSDKPCLSFSFTNNLVVIKYSNDVLIVPPKEVASEAQRRIIEILFPYGLRVHKDYIIKTDVKWKKLQ